MEGFDYEQSTNGKGPKAIIDIDVWYIKEIFICEN
jgi:hypothetical protein